MNNDANCFAVGVKHFGAGKDYKNLVGLTLGTGMGAGVIINNKLYSGVNCGVGEFGMISYLDSVFENYSSGHFFKNEYGVSGIELSENAKKGDKSAIEVFEIFGSHIGKAVITILHAVDPEIIVLGGSVSKAWPFFKVAMQREITIFEYRHVIESFTLEVNHIPDIAVLGAAALYLDAWTRQNYQ